MSMMSAKPNLIYVRFWAILLGGFFELTSASVFSVILLVLFCLHSGVFLLAPLLFVPLLMAVHFCNIFDLEILMFRPKIVV